MRGVVRGVLIPKSCNLKTWNPEVPNLNRFKSRHPEIRKKNSRVPKDQSRNSEFKNIWSRRPEKGLASLLLLCKQKMGNFLSFYWCLACGIVNCSVIFFHFWQATYKGWTLIMDDAIDTPTVSVSFFKQYTIFLFISYIPRNQLPKIW